EDVRTLPVGEPAEHGLSPGGVAGVVLIDHLQLDVEATTPVDVLHGELGTVALSLPPAGDGARQRTESADQQLVVAAGPATTAGGGEGQQSRHRQGRP